MKSCDSVACEKTVTDSANYNSYLVSCISYCPSLCVKRQKSLETF
jgi:hypothetical protein